MVMTEFQFGFLSVVAFLFVAILFVYAVLLLGRFVRPRRPSPDKRSVYECGERAIGQAWFNFNPRFYLFALIFIVFDAEIALTYPVAVVAKRWIAEGRAWIAVVEIVLFLAILVAALAYIWGKGELDWNRELTDAEEVP